MGTRARVGLVLGAVTCLVWGWVWWPGDPVQAPERAPVEVQFVSAEGLLRAPLQGEALLAAVRCLDRKRRTTAAETAQEPVLRSAALILDRRGKKGRGFELVTRRHLKSAPRGRYFESDCIYDVVQAARRHAR